MRRESKKWLLALARRAVEEVARDPSREGDFASADIDVGDPVLSEPRGAFVSLHRGGMLRGCVGTVIADKALVAVVDEMARAAALRDPRFAPVTIDEVDDLEIEISALGPIERVSSIDEVVVGRDGLVVQLGGHRGLLLPQVATERGWDREEFLRQTCRKAGLSADAATNPALRVSKFSAEVFNEKTV